MKNNIIENIRSSIDTKKGLLGNDFLEILEKIILTIFSSLNKGRKIMIAGNGGSAADAQHLAGELVCRFKTERRGFPCIALTTDTSVLTAWINDYRYNTVFSRQIEALGKPEDVFIGISTSGNSDNVVQAVLTAKKMGIQTICLLGKGGGKLNKLADLSIIVPSDDTPRIQESHTMIIHIICEEVDRMVEKQRTLADFVDLFPDQKIAVIGDLMLDEYLHCEVTRISPEAPVPVAKFLRDTFVLGGAANVANNLAALGVQTYAIGVTGIDEDSKTILRLMKNAQIAIDGVFSLEDRPTIKKSRVITGNHQIVRIDREVVRPIPAHLEQRILKHLLEDISGTKVLILSDYDKGLISHEFAQKLIYEAKQQGIKVFADPTPKTFNKFVDSYLIKPNKKEAESIIDQSFNEDYSNLRELGQKIQQKLRSNLLITLGSDGMAIFEDNTFSKMERTSTSEIFDVSGAGDTVIAALSAGISAGASIQQAAQIANFAAGIVVGKVGTATCSKEELLKGLSYE